MWLMKDWTESTFAQRLRHVQSESGFKSQRQFALSLGRDPGVVSRWMNEERDPDRDSLALVAERTGFSLSWLTTGSGPDRGEATRTVEPDHGMADALIADMIAAGVMTEAERASVRPRLIRELGASSTGTLDAAQQRAAARRALDEAHESIAAFRGAHEVATEAPDLSTLQPKKRGKR